MEWVYNNILQWNTGSTAWRYYWIGMNDLKAAGQLEWANTHDDERIDCYPCLLFCCKLRIAIFQKNNKIQKLWIE